MVRTTRPGKIPTTKRGGNGGPTERKKEPKMDAAETTRPPEEQRKGKAVRSVPQVPRDATTPPPLFSSLTQYTEPPPSTDTSQASSIPASIHRYRPSQLSPDLPPRAFTVCADVHRAMNTPPDLPGSGPETGMLVPFVIEDIPEPSESDTISERETASDAGANELVILHPADDYLECPIADCGQRYMAPGWTTMRASLLRHLKSRHEMKYITVNKCRLCLNILGRRPTLHSCRHTQPLPTQARLTPDRGPPRLLTCTTCDATFICQIALTTHLLAHRRQAAKQRTDDKLPEPNTRRRQRRQQHQSPQPQEIHVADTVEVCRMEDNNLQNISAETQQTNSTETSTIYMPTQADSRCGSSSAPYSPLCDEMDRESGSYTPEQEREGGDRDLEQASQPLILAEYAAGLNRIQRLPHTEDKWQEFVGIMEQMKDKIRKQYKIKPPTNEIPPRRENTINKEDPRTIQRMYATNRRRAIRIINNETYTKCDIPRATVEEHFAQRCREFRTEEEYTYERQNPTTEVDMQRLTPEEVINRLRKFENTSPGPDRICYTHLKKADPKGQVLAKVYNICMTYKRTPDDWKKSRTTLIYKKGEKGDISNWRPISLCNTIAKLYSGCLQRRLTEWMESEEVLSTNQKAFTPNDGVIEHTYKMERYISRGKKGGQTAIAWIDFRDAFGSIPKKNIITALQAAGAGERFTRTINEMQKGEKTTISTPEGPTNELHVERGTKQGCPLSGPLFNLAINPLVKLATGTTEGSDALAYADDLAIIRRTPVELQQAMDEVATEAARMGININTQKSKTLTIGRRGAIQHTVYTVEGNPILSLDRYDTETFLGRPMGFTNTNTTAGMAELTTLGLNICKAKITPWQRIDALKTFFYPALLFAMRIGKFLLKDWRRIDSIIRAEVKRTLNLPDDAANTYLYSPRAKNCIGIPLATDTAEAAAIDTAFKLLTSKDQNLRGFATEDLRKTAIKRGGNGEDHSTSQYLSGSNEQPFDKAGHDLTSVWARARRASRAVNARWTVAENTYEIQLPDATIGIEGRKTIFHQLRKNAQDQHYAELTALRSQGKTFPLISADRASGNFITNGTYMSFADWRFVHKARLNVVPLNGRNRQGGDLSCRRCSHPNETLPHVTQHCMIHSPTMQLRHNAVVERLISPLQQKGYETAENTQPLQNFNRRPDITAKAEHKIHIIDVTIPFENGRDAFEIARQTKNLKYEELRAAIEEQTHTPTTIEPIVVGALGAWDPKNDKFLATFMTRRFMKTFKNIIVAEVIKWTRYIYMEHITGRTQHGLEERYPRTG